MYYSMIAIRFHHPHPFRRGPLLFSDFVFSFRLVIIRIVIFSLSAHFSVYRLKFYLSRIHDLLLAKYTRIIVMWQLLLTFIIEKIRIS